MREEKEEERTRNHIRINNKRSLTAYIHTIIPLPTFPLSPRVPEQYLLCEIHYVPEWHTQNTVRVSHTHTHTYTHTTEIMYSDLRVQTHHRDHVQVTCAYTHTTGITCTVTCAYLDGIYKRASVPVQRRVKVT